jgi:hypothetical protein
LFPRMHPSIHPAIPPRSRRRLPLRHGQRIFRNKVRLPSQSRRLTFSQGRLATTSSPRCRASVPFPSLSEADRVYAAAGRALVLRNNSKAPTCTATYGRKPVPRRTFRALPPRHDHSDLERVRSRTNSSRRSSRSSNSRTSSKKPRSRNRYSRTYSNRRSASSGNSRTNSNRRDSRNSADLLRQAVNYGYEQGFRAGEADRQDRWRSNYQGSFAYQDASYGYTAITSTRTSTTTIFGRAFVTATKSDSTAAINTGNIRTARISCRGSPLGQILGFPSLR